MMEQNNNNNEGSFWYAVRGNHDDAALAAALGDKGRRDKKKYHWVTMGERTESQNNVVVMSDHNEGEKEEYAQAFLSDEDVLWLSELPYTITIPSSILMQDRNNSNDNVSDKEAKGEEVDAIIVHAGLIPGVPIEQQKVKDMVTLREVALQSSSLASFEAQKGSSKPKVKNDNNSNELQNQEESIRVPWANAWNGPQRVIFGHDARRGLQLQSMAIGLDT
eukprot:9190031-Ditylum_brightwellii.AAC.1